ncbi:hypothetical protein [uncultured Alistipes sp.]|uniref:hypothetical protein n=1 Tax=uncultured Alistipes sp. TaxID=538949 RepID=UPI0025EB1933|nr:hypothetical protein [uncultured Alistipes sp.]
MSKRLFFLAVFVAAGTLTVPAQNIKGHYVSKTEEGGVIYHTFPCTLFENKEAGDLTFDITYKEHQQGQATINLTYQMREATPADSICFVSGRTTMAGPVGKIYLEPEKKVWKHRYTFSADVAKVCTFFDEQATPEVTIYSQGREYIYRAKRSAWRSYAPIGYKIFEMIRINEQH